MKSLRGGLVVLALSAAGCGGTLVEPYHAEIQKFQQDRDAVLRADDGWLTIAGLWFLTQPETTFGSDPLSDIVLPDGAPARAGSLGIRKGVIARVGGDTAGQ